MFKKALVLSTLLGCGVASAFMPQTGTWIVTSENNGQPGRGFGLDVQNATLVMQMYGYEANGAPTFYLSAGPIANNSYTGQLHQYVGGQSFGSIPHAGREAGSAGTVRMRFVSGTKGYITFPNESEKEISRFTFAYSETPQSLIGAWALMAVDRYTGDYDSLFGDMSVVSGQSAYSSDGAMGCRFTGAAKGEVLCAWTPGGRLSFVTRFTLSVNDGEGWGGPTSASMSYPVTIRRLTNPAGHLTGLVLAKNAPTHDPSRFAAIESALDTAMENLARTPE